MKAATFRSLWEYKGHLGADYTPAEGEGSDILAVADGKVVKAKWGHTGYGNCIILDHGGGIQTLYAHCHELFVELGDEVKAGDVIASVGSSGNSTGTHLHFELRQNGTYVDPEKYIPEA
ncbi:MAG: M23 family metallopeptidase [Oscillospiraceae bacterium]|nr:M23 family metallopeptidase [Oscillospiraceae bacterium]